MTLSIMAFLAKLKLQKFDIDKKGGVKSEVVLPSVGS